MDKVFPSTPFSSKWPQKVIALIYQQSMFPLSLFSYMDAIVLTGIKTAMTVFKPFSSPEKRGKLTPPD